MLGIKRYGAFLALNFLIVMSSLLSAEGKKRYVLRPMTTSIGSMSTAVESSVRKLNLKETRILRELRGGGNVLVEASEAEMQKMKSQWTQSQVRVYEDQYIKLPPINVKAKSSGIGTKVVTQVYPYGILNVGATEAHAKGVTGNNVRVCISDTGIALEHPDLVGNIDADASFNAIDPTISANDDNFHGTHVAGTVAAVHNTSGVTGVAPSATLIAAKGLDENGGGFESFLSDTIDLCVAAGAHIINMSWGAATELPVVEQALIRAANAGVILVAAAGNNGAEVGYPAKYSTVLAVSAFDRENRPAAFTNFGPEIVVAAPGVNVLSTFPNGQYAVISGTSMAAPHVAGVLALMLSKNPNATANDIVAQALEGIERNLQGLGIISAPLSITF